MEEEFSVGEENKKQVDLLEKQRQFEVDQQLLEMSKDYYEKKEKVKSKLISWVLLLLGFAFIVFVGFKLLK